MGRLVEKVNLPIYGEMYVACVEDVSMESMQALQEPLKKLYEYEQEEEQGKLAHLPCKIGDTVYRICPKCNDNHNGNCEGCFWRNNKFGHGCSIYGFEGVKGIKRQIVPYKVIWGYIPNLIKHIGKHVFLTYEDAERELKEMELSE